MKKPKLIIIAGPTASGKTALAVEVAKRINGEVISADSMQIYEGVLRKNAGIAAAKPTEAEMCGIPHHLISCVPVTEPFSVAKYCEMARAAIDDILSRGKQPILCGGTGLYIRSVSENIQFFDEDTAEYNALRERYHALAEAEGTGAIMARLSAADPAAAAVLDERNLGRVIRALAVYELTGTSITEHNERSKSVPPPFTPVKIVLHYQNREILYERINKRVDIMLENGLLDEAEAAYKLHKSSPTAVQMIGHKEFFPYFAGEISLDEAVENLKMQTRRYAKRQNTWFKAEPGALLLTCDNKNLADITGEALMLSNI